MDVAAGTSIHDHPVHDEQDDRSDDGGQPCRDVEELVQRMGAEEGGREEAAEKSTDDSDDCRDDQAAGVLAGRIALAMMPARRPRMMNAMMPM